VYLFIYLLIYLFVFSRSLEDPYIGKQTVGDDFKILDF